MLLQYSTRRCARTIVYLSDPMPTGGPGTLLEQLVAGVALAGGCPIDRLVVDSGSQLTPFGLGANLDALIRSRADVPGRDVLIVEGPHRLACDRRDREGAVAGLLKAGFILRDGSGELHPAPVTVLAAIADTVGVQTAFSGLEVDAARAHAKRRGQGDRARHEGRGHA